MLVHTPRRKEGENFDDDVFFSERARDSERERERERRWAREEVER